MMNFFIHRPIFASSIAIVMVLGDELFPMHCHCRMGPAATTTASGRLLSMS